MKITEPGCYEMPMAEYLADPCPEPSLSSGIARTLLSRSPLHAWTDHPRLNPEYQSEDSAKFDLGSAAHALLLEGEDRMAVIEADDWRTKDAKAARDSARAEGRYPMLAHQYPAVLQMRDAALEAIARNPDLSGLKLADGKAEQVLVWKEGRAWLRCRPDWLSHDRVVQIHYKTTDASAEPDAWCRTMLGMGGDVEIAFYDRGNAATGAPEDRRSFFLVQEVYPPFACSFPALGPDFMAMAADKVEVAIARWAECMASGKWPGYVNRIAWLEAPGWAASQWEEKQLANPFGIPQDGEAYGRAVGVK